MKKTLFICYIIILIPLVSYSDTFRIGLMQAKEGEAKKYRPLLQYLSSFNIDLKFISFRTYSEAASQFSKGTLDGMFSGSGIAGVFILKNIAYPIVRPLHVQGWSTYWAVIIAPKGSHDYNNKAGYFNDKKVICSALASSGEFYVRTISTKINYLKAGTHGMALHALSLKKADIAVIKNRVWDSLNSKYPNLAKVGQDTGENPNNALIISNKANKKTVEKLKNSLLDLKNSKSQKGMAVKKSMTIQGYIPTTKNDFNHTLSLLKKAGVTPSFDFVF